jgi:hypothetical protein
MQMSRTPLGSTLFAGLSHEFCRLYTNKNVLPVEHVLGCAEKDESHFLLIIPLEQALTFHGHCQDYHLLLKFIFSCVCKVILFLGLIILMVMLLL